MTTTTTTTASDLHNPLAPLSNPLVPLPMDEPLNFLPRENKYRLRSTPSDNSLPSSTKRNAPAAVASTTTTHNAAGKENAPLPRLNPTLVPARKPRNSSLTPSPLEPVEASAANNSSSSNTPIQQQIVEQKQLLPGADLSAADLTKCLRTFFAFYQPAMASIIDDLVKQHHGHQVKLWRKLFRKYGPYPTEAREGKANLRSELILFFRHWEPSLENKVDHIIACFADQDDAMWQSLEGKYGSRSLVPGLSHLSPGSSKTKEDGGGGEEGDGGAAAAATAAVAAGDANASKAMDLVSRLNRFFTAVDSAKLPRVEEMARAYRYKEIELFDQLKLLYDEELEAPIGGFKVPDENDERKKTGKQLRLSHGRITNAQECERFLTAWATKFAPEKLHEVEVIAARFKGNETQLKENLESVFGPVSLEKVPRTLNLAAEREAERLRRETEAKAEPTEVRIKRVALQNRLVRYFEAHDHKMLKKCENMASQFLNFEEKLMRKLCRVYGPEPATGSRLENYRERLERFYRKYQPGLVKEVPELLRRHAGHEDELMHELCRKWGPEPPMSEASLHVLQSYAMGKLISYLKFHDPIMAPNAQSIFESYSKRGMELELVAALEQLYGPLPDHADFSITDPEHYGLPPEQQPRYWKSKHGVCSSTSGINSKNQDDDDDDQQQQQHDESSLPVVWTRTGVPPTDLTEILRHKQEFEDCEFMQPSDPAKIIPSDDDRRRLINFLGYYCPERVNSVDHIYAVFKGDMDGLVEVLERRYGPEPNEDNEFSKAALEDSAKQLRQLFGKFLGHYDPSKMYEIDIKVPQYVGRVEEARKYLHETYGPEPRYLPLAADLRRRLIFFFRWYDPAQLANVDVLADNYVGIDDQLFELLEEQYGPEPKINFKADRRLFQQRLQRFMEHYPDGSYEAIVRNTAALCPDLLSPSSISISTVVKRFEDFQDEFMMDLIAEFGAEPPDPQEEERLKREAQKMDLAQRQLRQRLEEFFDAYDPQQLGENVDTLVDSYWNDPESLMQQLFEAYGVEHEVVTSTTEEPEEQQPTTSTTTTTTTATVTDQPQQQKEEEEEVKVEESAAADLWNRVTRMYLKYSPDTLEALPALADKYKGHEAEHLDDLVRRYGPEPGADEDLTEKEKPTPTPLSVSALEEQPEEEEEKNQPAAAAAASAEKEGEGKQQPKVVVRPTVPISEQRAQLSDTQRLPAAQRAERILRKFDPAKLRDLPRMLKRYEGMEQDLVEVLEEKYELHPDTLVPISQQLRPEDLLDDDELEQARQRERAKEEALRRKPSSFSMRERCLRMYQIYDVPAMATLDLDLQKCNNDPQREQQYLDSLVQKYGEEPEGDIMYRHRIRRYYTYCIPESIGKIDEAMQRFKNREHVLMKMLLTKYKKPEPEDPEIIPPLSPEVIEYRTAARAKVAAIYQRHNPAKLAQLDTIMQKYEGEEENLLDQLDRKFDLKPEDVTIDGEELARVRAIVTKVYEQAQPAKLNDPNTMPGLLKRYRLDLNNLEEQVAQKYPKEYLVARRAVAGDADAAQQQQHGRPSALAAGLTPTGGADDDAPTSPISPTSPTNASLAVLGGEGAAAPSAPAAAIALDPSSSSSAAAAASSAGGDGDQQ